MNIFWRICSLENKKSKIFENTKKLMLQTGYSTRGRIWTGWIHFLVNIFISGVIIEFLFKAEKWFFYLIFIWHMNHMIRTTFLIRLIFDFLCVTSDYPDNPQFLKFDERGFHVYNNLRNWNKKTHKKGMLNRYRTELATSS